MVDLYIYYQVRDEHAALLAARVHAMQASLRNRHGVAGALKRRPEASNGMQTWMEIYPASDAAFEAALASAIASTHIGVLITGARHTEVFTDISSCA